MDKKEQPQTYIKHDCNNIRTIIHVNTEYYTLKKCMICNKIIKFRWKSWIKRLKSIL